MHFRKSFGWAKHRKVEEDIDKIKSWLCKTVGQTLSERRTHIPEVPTFQEFQQHEEARQEREQEILRERQEQEEIKNDENKPFSERQQAMEKSWNWIKNKMRSSTKEKERQSSFHCLTGSKRKWKPSSKNTASP